MQTGTEDQDDRVAHPAWRHTRLSSMLEVIGQHPLRRSDLGGRKTTSNCWRHLHLDSPQRCFEFSAHFISIALNTALSSPNHPPITSAAFAALSVASPAPSVAFGSHCSLRLWPAALSAASRRSQRDTRVISLLGPRRSSSPVEVALLSLIDSPGLFLAYFLAWRLPPLLSLSAPEQAGRVFIYASHDFQDSSVVR